MEVELSAASRIWATIGSECCVASTKLCMVCPRSQHARKFPYEVVTLNLSLSINIDI